MNASVTLPFIPVCCVCGLAREANDSPGLKPECWSDFDEYLNRHGLRGTEYKLTHAYCPVCVNQFIPAKRKVPREQVEAPVETSPQMSDSATLILQTVRQRKRCELDALVRFCPQLTWNQIFLEVDRLSRSGHLRLSLSGRPGAYEVTLPVDQDAVERFVSTDESTTSDIGKVRPSMGGIYHNKHKRRSRHHAASV